MVRKQLWWIPLTGVAFVIVGIVSFLVGGEPKSADDPVREIVSYYADNDDEIMISAMLAAVAGLLLIFFGAYLRGVLRGSGERDSLALVSFIGLTIVAIGFAIDATISFALADKAQDVDPAAVQALQMLWDNDFIPIMLGVLAFLWATGLAILRGAPLPKWIGWIMIVLGVVGVTPIGFAAAIGAALLVLILSIMLAIREKSAAPPSTATPPPITASNL